MRSRPSRVVGQFHDSRGAGPKGNDCCSDTVTMSTKKATWTCPNCGSQYALPDSQTRAPICPRCAAARSQSVLRGMLTTLPIRRMLGATAVLGLIVCVLIGAKAWQAHARRTRRSADSLKIEVPRAVSERRERGEWKPVSRFEGHDKQAMPKFQARENDWRVVWRPLTTCPPLVVRVCLLDEA